MTQIKRFVLIALFALSILATGCESRQVGSNTQVCAVGDVCYPFSTQNFLNK